ncbi:ribonuclease H-like domain-containing protein [Tanacetum coccineum]
MFAKSLASIWIRSFHMYASVARFQRQEQAEAKTKEGIVKALGLVSAKQVVNVECGSSQFKQSYAFVMHRGGGVKNVDTMSNLCRLCREEGLKYVKIHHIGGLWLWLHFQNVESCSAFKNNSTLKSLFTTIKPVSKNFHVDERMVWVEISRLPLCAWGSNAFKKVVTSVGKLMFFEDDHSAAMSLCRVCIATTQMKFIFEMVKVDINGEEYDVHIHKLGSWSINIVDPLSSNSEIDPKVDDDYTNEEESECEGEEKVDEAAEGKKTDESDLIRPPDMNEVQDECERYGTIFSPSEAHTFNLFIDRACLLDLPMGGRIYTWMNNTGTKTIKLDSFLVSSSMIDALPDLKVTALPRGWSYHIPLMLHIEKLKVIKQKIKAWNHTVRNSEFSRKQEVLLRLTDIEDKIDKCVASDIEKQERMHLLKEYDDLNKLEEMDTVKKSRIKWDVEGDENSKFFHGLSPVSPQVRLNTDEIEVLAATVTMEEIKGATVYMHQPPGFRDPQHPDHVCLLQRSLYGLKQAPRAWFQRFTAYAARVGFLHSRCDSSLFIYRQGSDTAYLLVYVDDIVLTASSTALLQRIIASLHAEFSMTDLGSLNYFLGVSVTRNTSGMFLSQQKYATDVLERAGMLTCNPCRTPVHGFQAWCCW